MRKLFAVFLIFIFLISFAQGSNPFSSGENHEEESAPAEKYKEPTNSQYSSHPTADAPCENQDVDCDCDNIPNEVDDDECAPANPSDPVPIDDYIPFLAITALAIIFCQGQKQKKLS